MKVPVAIGIAGLVLAGVFAGFLKFSMRHDDPGRSRVLSAATWQHMTLPGELSKAHAFLANNCAACHTPVKGIEAKSCIVCHSNNQALLQRQETAFHADVQSCIPCHREHRGRIDSPIDMDHSGLTRIGLKQLQSGSAQDTDATARIVRWLEQPHRSPAAVAAPRLRADEAVLNCSTCHGVKDKHFGFFGADCARCHEATKWNIPEYLHPAPTSQTCASCHQPPASHYRAGFCAPPARLSQCYVCHKTASWAECAGGGFYRR